MTSGVARAAAAAEDLAWRPMANVSGIRLVDRHEAHERLVAALAEVRLSPAASPELRCLVDAMRRAARATYSNRRWAPYYERRQAIVELRGALDVWKRSES